MAEALLVADQHVDEGFFPPKLFDRRAARFWTQVSPSGTLVEKSLSRSDLMDAKQTLQGYDFVLRDESSATINTHLGGAKEALRKLAESGKRAQGIRRSCEELVWLAENRHKFSGQWIALRGDCLLAVAPTAKEVFSKVADDKTPPLVIRVDDEGLPFGGW